MLRECKHVYWKLTGFSCPGTEEGALLVIKMMANYNRHVVFHLSLLTYCLPLGVYRNLAG